MFYFIYGVYIYLSLLRYFRKHSYVIVTNFLKHVGQNKADYLKLPAQTALKIPMELLVIGKICLVLLL